MAWVLPVHTLILTPTPPIPKPVRRPFPIILVLEDRTNKGHPVTFAAPAMPYPPPPMHPLGGQPQYYDYSNSFGPTTSSFRPTKRPRQLTEEEAAAITRNFTRGDFFVGTSAPVRIDPRLPVRLTLAEGDQVHFSIGEAMSI